MGPRFVIDLFGFEIPDTVPVSLALTLITLVLAWVASRRLRVADPRAWQVALETGVSWIHETLERILGEDPRPYAPLVGGLMLWIALCNLLSVMPMLRPPTADLSTTVALALVVLFAVPAFGIRRHGLLGYLRTYIRPHPLLLPFNLIGEATRTLALAVRLFGNSMSSQMIAAVLLIVAGLIVPIPLMMLGLLTGFVQAYIFGILAAIYIAAAVQVDQKRVAEREPASSPTPTP